jgi:hypothetical protein
LIRLIINFFIFVIIHKLCQLVLIQTSPERLHTRKTGGGTSRGEARATSFEMVCNDTTNIHPLAASAHEVGTAQVRVLIGCVFVEIVIESETCHICSAVLLTI